MSLYDVLLAAADGRPPAPDGTVEVLPQQGPAAAVVAFSAHFMVAADVEPAWVRAQLPAGDWSAPHGARFLVALADRIGADVGALDVVLARSADRLPGDPIALEEIAAREHPRGVRALRYREDVRVWRAPGVAAGRAGRGVPPGLRRGAAATQPLTGVRPPRPRERGPSAAQPMCG